MGRRFAQEYCTRLPSSKYQPKPLTQEPSDLAVLKVTGALLANSLIYKEYTGLQLSQSVLRVLLGDHPTEADLQVDDPQLFQSYLQLHELSPADLSSIEGLEVTEASKPQYIADKLQQFVYGAANREVSAL